MQTRSFFNVLYPTQPKPSRLVPIMTATCRESMTPISLNRYHAFATRTEMFTARNRRRW